ncbi:hypothetical protein F750_0934 [Streptomyces sp. PAMC 26508]|nr:hypothetical protein F750_0934 [Streptomyces sp. PAMC 26508]
MVMTERCRTGFRGRVPFLVTRPRRAPPYGSDRPGAPLDRPRAG